MDMGSGKRDGLSPTSEMMNKHWMSCYKFTIKVSTVNGIIVETAPIARKFIGQPFANLERWMKKLGGYKHASL